ncbi:MAG: TldD/PmbA family protein [Sulfolobaceae archaeon]
MNKLVEELVKKGFQQVAVLEIKVKSTMVKFAESKVSVIQKWSTSSISILIGKNKKFTVLEFKGDAKLDNNIENLIDKIEESPYYPILSNNQRSYKRIEVENDVDRLIQDPSSAVADVLDYAEYPIYGMINFVRYKRILHTSTGFEGEEEKTFVNGYARAFNGEYSGQWAFFSRNYSPAKLREMVKKACEFASITGEVKIDEGKYNVLLSPLVFANLMNYLMNMASAMSVEYGMSIFLNTNQGEKVASEKLSLYDSPRNDEIPYSTAFDDEGTFTYNKAVIENGTFQTLLYNNALARLKGKNSTGNAGWTYPHSWGIEVKPGEVSENSLFSSNLIFFNNNWYTRFQNYYEGTFSTVGRDAVVVYREGKPVGVAKRIRIADSLRNIIKNIEDLSKERYNIMWWESEMPVITPYTLIRDVRISKSTF